MKTKTHAYQIVTSNYESDLEAEVNGLIQRGWEPVGGIAMTGDGCARKFAQAMILRTASTD